MQKSAVDDVACKHLRLSSSGAKQSFGKRCNNVTFPFCIIEITFLCRDLSLINAWCCRADANINSLWRFFYRPIITMGLHLLLRVCKVAILSELSKTNIQKILIFIYDFEFHLAKSSFIMVYDL